MKFETIDQLYYFNALDEDGEKAKIAYVARSLEAATTKATERNYSSVEYLSVSHLEGVQRPSIAVHEALVDPLVGPSWMPFVRLLDRVNRPSATKPIVTVRFNEKHENLNRASSAELRINALPDGRCYLRIGPAAQINRANPGNPEVLGHLGWLPPRNSQERGYWRLLPSGWNNIHAAHLVIHALSLTTGISPSDWFTFGAKGPFLHSGAELFDRESLGTSVFYRVPEDEQKLTRLVKATTSGFISGLGKTFLKVVPRV